MRINAIAAFVMTPDAAAPVTSVVSYRASFPRSADVPPAPACGAIDGLIQRPGLPVGDAPVKFPVPPEFLANCPNLPSGRQ